MDAVEATASCNARERVSAATDARGSGPQAATTTDTVCKLIEIRTPAVVRSYAARLAQALRRRGDRVRIVAVPTAQTPSAVDWLLWLERMIYRSRATSFEPTTTEALNPGLSADDECDLLIDLVGDAAVDRPTIRLVFAQGEGEIGLLRALLSSRAPRVGVVETEPSGASRTLLSACLAVERPRALGSALDIVTPRLLTLLTQATAERARESRPSSVEDSPSRAVTPFAFAASTFAERLNDRLGALLRRPDCWRIATRRIAGDGVMESLDWSGPQWEVLPDDGMRFYADPFFFAWQGRRWLFCEEFPYATGKGILSVAPVSDTGQVGAPEPVLETGTHLSWPQVFAHDGHVYMIPESAAAGRVELWRADEFPRRWVLDRVLLEDVRVHDAVLHLAQERAYMLATVNDDGGSSWDAFGLFHAPGLFGRWEAHPANPLIVDASCVRGAGPIVRRRGELWRATQDCRTDYGDALAFCRITQLDSGGYAHDVVARLDAPLGYGATGTHTLSRLGDLEAIDLRGARQTPPPRG